MNYKFRSNSHLQSRVSSSGATAISSLLLICVLLVFSSSAQKKTEPRSSESLGRVCTLDEVASSVSQGGLLLPEDQRLEFNLWTFCDGVTVTERFHTSESSKDFESWLLEMRTKFPRIREISNKVSGDSRAILYKIEGNEKPWLYVKRIEATTYSFQGSSLIHILFLEKLKTLKKH